MLSLHDRAARTAAGAIVTLALLLALPATSGAQTPPTISTTTSLQVLSTQPTHGQRATVKATVTATGSVPTGAVQFQVDGAWVGTAVPLVNGSAQAQTPPLVAGLHTVQVFYPDTGDYIHSDHSVQLMVNRAMTTTTLRITPDTGAVAGQNLVLEAAVKPGASELGPPTGMVTMLVNGTGIGTMLLSTDGTLVTLARLPAISMMVVLRYSGDVNHLPSDATAALTVNRAGTVIGLTATPATPTADEAVEVRATIDSLAPSMWYPAGTFTAAVDGQPVPGAVTFEGDGGYAAFTRGFPAGVHHITAHFTGDGNFLAADAALDLTVAGTPGYQAPAVRRVAARGLTVKAKPGRDRRAPYTYTVTGALQLPSSVTAAAGNSGNVDVDASIKGKRVTHKTVKLTSKGTYKATLTVRKKGSVSITATFAGNTRLLSVQSRAIKVKAG